MIQLSLKLYESQVYSHPTLGGTSYVEYILNHGFGVQPLDINLFYDAGDNKWLQIYDLDAGTANYIGYQITGNTADNQETRVWVHYLGGAKDIKFKAFAV